MTTATVTPIASAPAHKLVLDDVIEAMRSIQTESDRWHLAEALAKQVPGGSEGFSEILDQATAEGVAGKLSLNTLRLYRDAALRWPADKRVANVSFSAHREAMVLESIDAAAKMLADLAKNAGAGNVTVAAVRKAIAVQQGKVTAAPAATTSQKAVDVLADIKQGAPQLIAAISPATVTSELDQLHAGLTKAIAHVERLRAKAARKTAAAKPSSTPVPKPSPGERKVAGEAITKARGDLRGL